MKKRIILQAAFLQDGLVIHPQDEHAPDEPEKAILEALPAEHADPELQIFDEADDDPETRQFADNEHLHHGRVFHIGHCPQVTVSVRYAGRTIEHCFPPATRIGRVKRWAVHSLGIAPADANELVIQVAGTSTQPSRDQHVGCFIEEGACKAIFDLVRSYTVNGSTDLSPDHAKLLAHLDQAPFALGEMNGHWHLRNISWPFVFIDIRANDNRIFTLRLQCDGYPNLPTGAFWDPTNNSWLPANLWPKAGGRFGTALRTDWQHGTALYIPCDRMSIAGHEPWRQLYPAWCWDPGIGIARYLEVVWTLLNGDGHVAPAA